MAWLLRIVRALPPCAPGYPLLGREATRRREAVRSYKPGRPFYVGGDKCGGTFDATIGLCNPSARIQSGGF
jgi:hypothetical protein